MAAGGTLITLATCLQPIKDVKVCQNNCIVIKMRKFKTLAFIG